MLAGRRTNADKHADQKIRSSQHPAIHNGGDQQFNQLINQIRASEPDAFRADDCVNLHFLDDTDTTRNRKVFWSNFFAK